MRDVTFAIVMAIGILALCLTIAQGLIGIQDAHGQLHNPYWPFTVETQVRDR